MFLHPVHRAFVKSRSSSGPCRQWELMPWWSARRTWSDCANLSELIQHLALTIPGQGSLNQLLALVGPLLVRASWRTRGASTQNGSSRPGLLRGARHKWRPAQENHPGGESSSAHQGAAVRGSRLMWWCLENTKRGADKINKMAGDRRRKASQRKHGLSALYRHAHQGRQQVRFVARPAGHLWVPGPLFLAPLTVPKKSWVNAYFLCCVARACSNVRARRLLSRQRDRQMSALLAECWF